MEYRVARLDEIRVAFFRATQEALAGYSPDEVWLVAPAQEADIDLKKLAVLCFFLPGEIARKEFGGEGSLAERRGFWKVQVSILFGTDENKGWELAQTVEDAFLPYASDSLPVTPLTSENPETDPVCPAFCDFPYTEYVGELPDKRIGITVSIPWWTWTQS